MLGVILKCLSSIIEITYNINIGDEHLGRRATIGTNEKKIK